MVYVLADILIFPTHYSESFKHKQKLETASYKLAQVVINCGKEVFGSSRSKQKEEYILKKLI